MTIPDVNILLYAYDSRSRFHDSAREWWERRLGGENRVGLPWHVIVGFIRIVTSHRIFETPMAPSDAVLIVRSWLEQPCVELLSPGSSHAEILFKLIGELGVAGNLTSDAHLAAIALEHRAELASADRAFSRFHGLRWVNPLGIGARPY